MLSRVTISALLKTVIATLGAAILIMLSLSAWESWNRVTDSSRALAASSSASDLFTALHNLRVDRTTTATDLNIDKTMGLEPTLQTARTAEVPALKSALETLPGVGFPDQQAQIAELADRVKRLLALHEESTAALAQPKSARRPGIAEDAFRQINELLALVDKLSTEMMVSIKLQDAYIDQLMELKQLAWATRTASGDGTIVILGGLAGQPMPATATDDYTADIAKANASWTSLKDLAKGMPLPPRFSQAMQKADRVYFDPEYSNLGFNTLKALVAHQPPGTTADQWKAVSIEKQSSIEDVAQTALDIAKERAATQHAQAFRDLIIQLALMAAALVVVFGMMVVVSRRVSKPLQVLSQAMRRLAEGDFTVTIPGTGRHDEVGMIAEAAEAVADGVGSTIGNIKMAATEVTSASAEISTSTTDLSQRTEEQAASLEETSASMEQISATVKKNAENAKTANEFATETSEVAERGGAVVSDAVTAMARIEESSRKISDIIGVIDEIARQTNLLALNAAVEAARAGEAGRGFAVVASEVRSLAQRSSQAAKDIKDLITNSNSQVKDGVDLVNKAGESLQEIVASIKKVATIVGDIANASLEQSSGIEQVNKALTQMDEVTQQNSALVEENAATAKTLEQQAKSMDERVAAFRLRAHTEIAQPAAAPARQIAAAPKPLVRPVVNNAPKRAVPAAPKRGLNGHRPAGRMQTALATAIDTDDWKEF